jgi:hypothetical protein
MKMSLLTPATSISQLTTNSTTGKSDTFQDLPIISRSIKLNIFELENSDKQIINELVYRFCRILTRKRNFDSECRVLVIDAIGSINPIRLGSILKRDSARLRKIRVVRQCKINSTFLTLDTYINKDGLSKQPKLIVIYHDEYLISKTLKLLEKFLPNSKSQIVLVIPKLGRSDRDILHLMPNNQLLRCDFIVDRREIGPAPPDATNDSYQKYLNQVYFQRYTKNKSLPERIEGLLTEEGLHLSIPIRTSIPRTSLDTVDFAVPNKKIKIEKLCNDAKTC